MNILFPTRYSVTFHSHLCFIGCDIAQCIRYVLAHVGPRAGAEAVRRQGYSIQRVR